MTSPVICESAALCSSIKVSSLAFPVIRLIAANGEPMAASPFPQTGSEEEAAASGRSENKEGEAYERGSDGTVRNQVRSGG